MACRLLAKQNRLTMMRNAVWALSNLCRGKNPPPDFSKVTRHHRYHTWGSHFMGLIYPVKQMYWLISGIEFRSDISPCYVMIFLWRILYSNPNFASLLKMCVCVSVSRCLRASVSSRGYYLWMTQTFWPTRAGLSPTCQTDPMTRSSRSLTLGSAAD